MAKFFYPARCTYGSPYPARLVPFSVGQKSSKSLIDTLARGILEEKVVLPS